MPETRAMAALIALAFSVVFVGALYIFFDPVWETNDDVAMSMVAHGYGLAAYGSPTLVFSNVVWGAIVRSIPSIGGLLGYSVATIACLGLIAAACIFLLRQSGLPWWIGLIATVLVMLRPILIPQFTMTAGLLAVAGILGLIAYEHKRGSLYLIVAASLLFVGSLIRDVEVALVCIVAFPLLPWRLAADRKVQIASLALTVCIATATAANHFALQGSEWKYFFELNFPRALFTDFSAGSRLLERPDVMARYGWSNNDIALISNYFFVDKTLADPVVMNKVISDLGFGLTQMFLPANGWISVRTITDDSLLPLALPGFGLMLLAFRPALGCAWLILLGLMFAIGGLGRLGVSRIYAPLLSLLILLPLCDRTLYSGWRKWTAVFLLGIGLIVSIVGMRDSLHFARSDMRPPLGSQQSTAVWGSSLPFESVFPLFTHTSDTAQTRIYGLNVFTFAPMSVATADESAGRGLIARLRSPTGIEIVATSGLLKLLEAYCEQHLQAHLTVEDLASTLRWTIHRARCVSDVSK